MNSKTELKILQLSLALLPYLTVPAILFLFDLSVWYRIAMMIIVIGPILARDLKKGTFKLRD